VNTNAPIRVLITDRHVLSRQGIRRLLEDEPDIAATGEASDASTLFETLRAAPPDVVLLDSSLPGSTPAEHIASIRGVAPAARIVLVEDGDAPLNGARSAGDAVVGKSDSVETVVSTIRALVGATGTPVLRSPLPGSLSNDGQPDNTTRLDTLSRRERQVLKLVASGYTNQEAADRLGVSVKTVEGYRSRVMRKLEATNRARLVRVALETGLLDASNLD
jgi:DNA-binding NarL/FixJ family response regulator